MSRLPTCRFCWPPRWMWRRGGPGIGPRPAPTGRWTASNPTPGCSNAPVRCTPQLAAEGYLSPWRVLTPEPDGSVSIPAELAG